MRSSRPVYQVTVPNSPVNPGPGSLRVHVQRPALAVCRCCLSVWMAVHACGAQCCWPIGAFLFAEGAAPRPRMLLPTGKGGPVLRAVWEGQYARPVTSWPLRGALRARGRRLGARNCVPDHPFALVAAA